MANSETKPTDPSETAQRLDRPRTFYIAGVQHRPDNRSFSTLEMTAGDELQLVGEPTNKYDRYAVKCLFDGCHIGYVPKPVNVDFWALHAAGYKAHATFRHVDFSLPSWQWFQVEVTFSKKDSTSTT